MGFQYAQVSSLPATPVVWVVDDDEDDQLFIRFAFNAVLGAVQVKTLNDGDQLLTQLLHCDQLPGLILLDINLARQNGFDTLSQVRSIPSFATLPVVMFSSSSDAADEQRCMALGANQYLTKPGGYNQLVQLVKSLSEEWALV